MLERLAITNFAVARAVELAPGPGLNVFTGETGAGKSLIVDALDFAFGGRRGREVIGSGHDAATVLATLSFPDATTAVERTVRSSGRSTARLDGETATIEELRTLGARAVDIHGQSEQLTLLRPAVQLAALDAFAGLGADRERLAEGVRELRALRRRIVLARRPRSRINGRERDGSAQTSGLARSCSISSKRSAICRSFSSIRTGARRQPVRTRT